MQRSLLFASAAAAVAAVATAASAAASALVLAPPALTPVFVLGGEGYYCFRIPALVALSSTELLAFAEGRKLSCADHGFVDLVSKRSLDGGRTWGALQVVRSESTDAQHVTVGNPAPVVLAGGGGGALLLPFCRNNIEVGVLRSDDRGHSWRLSANISVPAGWSWVATGPPGSMQVQRGGRIVVPMNFANKSVPAASSAFLSDDGGATFRLARDTVTDGNEDQAVELAWRSNATASVLHLSMRSGKEGHRLAAESADGGDSWSAPWATITETACEGSVLALPRSRRLVMSTAFAAQRTNMTLHASSDDGHSWAPLLQVFGGFSAYSSLIDASTAGGAEAVGILFEQGATSPFAGISFARVELPPQ